MTDPTNDIDALLRELGDSASCGYKPWRLAALTALVAERNALRSALAGANISRAALALRIEKLESQGLTLPRDPPAASDLRERDEAMTRWMDQVTAMLCHSMTHGHDTKQELVTRCDKAIAAMRKGETDGK